MHRFFTRTNIGIRIDKQQLKEEYKWLMKKYHPDVNKVNPQIASQITTLYSTLKRDGPRCKFLLEQKGFFLSDTYVQYKLDNSLLEEFMYIAETIEYTTDKTELNKLENTLSKEKENYIAKVENLWNNLDYHGCMSIVYHINYIEKLEDRLTQKNYELDVKKLEI